MKLRGWVGFTVWINCPKFTVFWGLPLSSWPCSSCSQIQGGPNTQVVHVLGPYLETCLGAELLRADHMALQRNQNNLLLHKTITGHSAQRLCTIYFTNHYFLPYLVSETKTLWGYRINQSFVCLSWKACELDSKPVCGSIVGEIGFSEWLSCQSGCTVASIQWHSHSQPNADITKCICPKDRIYLYKI